MIMKEYFKEIDEFYPTPMDLAEKMLSCITRGSTVKSVLEPSAGKGDLLDALLRKSEALFWNLKDSDIDCIEKDELLRSVLKGKNYRVIGDDFEKFTTYKHYDLILMNPPFSRADKHLLKAINLAENNGGAKILCLLNAQTLRNDSSNLRKILCKKLSEYNAQIEYIQNAFSSAERQTDVEIAFVNVDVKVDVIDSAILQELEKTQSVEEQTHCNIGEIVTGNYIEQAVLLYQKEVTIIKRLFDEYFSVKDYLSREFVDGEKEYVSKWKKKPLLSLQYCRCNGTNEEITKYTDINGVLRKVRYKYWKELFNSKEFVKNLTSDMRDSLYNLVFDMQNYDFSLFNIRQIQNQFIKKMLDNIDDSIEKLYKTLTEQYSYYPECQNNIHYYNGWCSNKAGKVCNKVIIPVNGAFSNYSFSFLNVGYINDVIGDIQKVFSYLDSECSDNTPVEYVTQCANTRNNSKNIHYRYFDCTFYKKGTCHIKFTNTDVVDALNIYVGKKHKWLPPTYGKVAYDDMTQEEKKVIDEFQGKDEYAKVYKNPSKYIIETNQMLSLPEIV